MRNRRADLIHFGQKTTFVNWLNYRLILRNDEGADRCERGRQTYLKAASARDDAFVAKPGKLRVRVARGPRVAEWADRHIARSIGRTELYFGERRVAGGIGRDDFKCRIRGEHVELPSDPAQPIAGFAVGDALDAIAENRRGGAKDLTGIRQRHAADQ